METMQIRMNEQSIKEVDRIVKSGFYANRADVIRDAVRRFIFESQIGTIKNNSNSIKEIKKTREKLSKERINLQEINNL
jgi:Arc/MetJ-type ribon-helix-helix transcriptional regulator